MQANNTLSALRSFGLGHNMISMNWRDRFKHRFDHLKRTQRLTQEKLGEMLGVTQGTVGHWIHRRRTPDTLEMYEKLAAALQVHPAWLLYGVGEEDKLSKEAAEFGRAWEALPDGEKIAMKEVVHSLSKSQRYDKEQKKLKKSA